jgi:hypothetical protein
LSKSFTFYRRAAESAADAPELAGKAVDRRKKR